MCSPNPPAPGDHVRPRPVATQSRQFLPVLPAIGRLEDGGILDPRIHVVGIGQRRLEMPDALELPWMGRPVVPLMRAGHPVVDELVSDRLPGLAAIVRTLDELSEPAAALGGIQPIRISRRPLEVINLPASEMRPVHLPFLAFPVRFQRERAFARTDQHPYSAHASLLPLAGFMTPADATTNSSVSLYRRTDGLEIDSRLLAVRLHLAADHVVIRSSGPHQLLVRTALDDSPLFHQQDEVSPANSRQPVGDDERRPVGQQRRHRGLNELLALGVEVARGFVEDEYLR